jgi:hydrogenase 3 maturation protease
MTETLSLGLFLKGYTKLVIIGLGNPLRGDDAIGLEIIKQLRTLLSNSLSISRDQNSIHYTKYKIHDTKEVVLIDAETVLENFIGPVIKEQPSHILITDAVLDETKQSGDWMLVEPEQMDSGFHSTHSMPVSLFCEVVKKEISCTIMGIGITPEVMHASNTLSNSIDQTKNTLTEIIRNII